MISYELAKKLKDAGFPQDTDRCFFERDHTPLPGNGYVIHTGLCPRIANPSLSELIEACGDMFSGIVRDLFPDGSTRHWIAHDVNSPNNDSYGSTPEEAVANLYIAIYARH